MSDKQGNIVGTFGQFTATYGNEVLTAINHGHGGIQISVMQQDGIPSTVHIGTDIAGDLAAWLNDAVDFVAATTDPNRHAD